MTLQCLLSVTHSLGVLYESNHILIITMWSRWYDFVHLHMRQLRHREVSGRWEVAELGSERKQSPCTHSSATPAPDLTTCSESVTMPGECRLPPVIKNLHRSPQWEQSHEQAGGCRMPVLLWRFMACCPCLGVAESLLFPVSLATWSIPGPPNTHFLGHIWLSGSGQMQR